MLPIDSILLESNSQTPIAFTEQGELTAQVFQGDHYIYFRSALAQPIAEIRLHTPVEGIFSGEETWTWEGAPSLRTVEIGAARTLNASQVELPQGWSGQSVLGVDPALGVTLKELRRGQEFPPKNQLSLVRSFGY